MHTLSSLRDSYGTHYVTIVGDTVVPWQPLSIGEFLYYEEYIKNQDIVMSVLEDEIFKKCVLDEVLIKHIHHFPAGIVTVVVQNILDHSGPKGIDEFNNALDSQREVAANPLHNLTALICKAFPAYKPEDVYNMPYDVYLLRLAQAEQTLQLQEPIKLLSTEEIESLNKKRRIPPAELRAAWEKNNNKRTEPVPSPSPKPVIKPEVKKPIPTTKKESPSIVTKPDKLKKIVNLDRERMTMDNAAGTADDQVLRAKMLEESKMLFKDRFSPSK